MRRIRAAAAAVIVVASLALSVSGSQAAVDCERRPTHPQCATPTPAPTATLIPTATPVPTATPTAAPTATPTPAPSGLVWLIDPATDQRVRLLGASDTVSNPFALEVNTTSTGSVETTLDGGAVRNENNPPFAPCTDATGDFAPCDWTAGEHVLTVEVWSLDNGGGTLLASGTLSLTVEGSTGSDNVSGIPMRAPPAGMTRYGGLEFTADQPLGQGPSATTAALLQPRPDLAGDCTFNDSSGRGRYCWKATTSEHDGVLDIWHHTEAGACKTSGFTFVHAGAADPSCNYVAGPKWTLPEQDEFAVTYVARFDDIPGRKVAALRWCGPGIGQPGYCEDNFVEAKLDGGACKGNAFHHLESSNQQVAQQLCIDLNDWHEYRMVVKPGQFVDFILDGVTVLHATSGVTTETSYWVFQTETYLAGQAIPEPDLQGHIEIDWLTVDLP